MYTACTYRLADALGIDWLHYIPRYFVWIALAAWTLVTAGLALAVVRFFLSGLRHE